MTWDWQSLVDDAKTWEDGRHVNWQNVSRQYGVHQLTNPGKLAGIDIERFRNAHGQELGTPQERRLAKRLKSGRKKHYENGTLTQPVSIVEREYKQIRFTPD